MKLLDGVVRPYAWGSRTAIASLRQKPVPSPHPEAELWFGAHTEGPATVLGSDGEPEGTLLDVIDALIEQGANDLTVVNNNAGNGDVGLAKLIQLGRVKKIICSFPRQSDSWHFDEKYRAGEIELEVVPQGNLAERMRAAVSGAQTSSRPFTK